MKWHSPLVSWVLCYLVFLGTKVKKNNQIATVESWGPTFRVAVDIIVHSKQERGTYQSILRFTNKDDENISNHWTRKHIPGIFYWGFDDFHISSEVSHEEHFYTNIRGIKLNEWYHIEIAQTKKNGKVREIHDFSLLM